jgi:hypothetical protein
VNLITKTLALLVTFFFSKISKIIIAFERIAAPIHFVAFWQKFSQKDASATSCNVFVVSSFFDIVSFASIPTKDLTFKWGDMLKF